MGWLFGTNTRTLCDCVVFGEPLTAPVLSSVSRLGKVRQAPSLLNPPQNLLIKSTLRRAKRDNRSKVGRLHSLSQEEEVPWCTFTCAWARWCRCYNPLHSWRRDSERVRSESSEAHMLRFLLLRLCRVTVWGLQSKRHIEKMAHFCLESINRSFKSISMTPSSVNFFSFFFTAENIYILPFYTSNPKYSLSKRNRTSTK